jgi:hypothetical protein
MKFFTAQWAAAADAPDRVFQDYEQYWRTIRNFLPDEVLAFEAAHTLHDSTLRRVRHDEADGTLALAFDGWDAAFSAKQAIALEFGGVRVYSRRQHDALPAVADAAHIAYWEWDWTGEALELRLLSGALAETRIVATRFAFAVGPRD